MEIESAFKFTVGPLKIGDHPEFSYASYFPIATFPGKTVETKSPSAAEKKEKLAELQSWMRIVGLTNEKHMAMAEDLIESEILVNFQPDVVDYSPISEFIYNRWLIIFWLFDDTLEKRTLELARGSPGDSEKAIMEDLALFSSVWRDPRGYDPEILKSRGRDPSSHLGLALGAWKLLVLDIEKEFPHYLQHEAVIQGMEKQFKAAVWAHLKRNKKFHSEYLFRHYRRDDVDYECLFEYGVMICNVSISSEVRNHPYFTLMIQAAGDVLTIINDIASLPIENEENFNLIFVKMRQGANVLEALNETMRCVWDATYQCIYFAELLLAEFPNEPQLFKYVQMVFNLNNGTLMAESNMRRYRGFTGRPFPMKKFPTLDEQFEYAYQELLKSESNS